MILSGGIMFVILYFWNISQVTVLVAILLKVIVGIVVYFSTLLCLSFIFKVNYMKIIKKSIKNN